MDGTYTHYFTIKIKQMWVNIPFPWMVYGIGNWKIRVYFMRGGSTCAQDPSVYGIFKDLYGTDALYVTTDRRYVQKIAGIKVPAWK